MGKHHGAPSCLTNQSMTRLVEVSLSLHLTTQLFIGSRDTGERRRQPAASAPTPVAVLLRVLVNLCRRARVLVNLCRRASAKLQCAASKILAK